MDVNYSMSLIMLHVMTVCRTITGFKLFSWIIQYKIQNHHWTELSTSNIVPNIKSIIIWMNEIGIEIERIFRKIDERV